MNIKKKAYVLEELTLLYVTVDGVMSFTVVPTALADKVKDKKFERNKPMVQVALLGDVGEREYFSGNCMQNGSSCFEFSYADQKVYEREDGTEIVTVFKNGKGQTFEHHVTKPHGVNALALHNVLINDGADITVEMIASASIGAITPFREQNDADFLKTYRMKSCWSGEGRLNVIPATDLQLEDAWSSYGIRQDRIGQVGSMPCRKYMPFYAVEDIENACVWAMSIEAPMSWQIDAVHHLGAISLTGGIADFSSGHFRINLKKGELFT
ncbi:MAG: hypothetical protein K2M95_00325, partial [Clostridiales bacterium]|nr:hypothetical protein [Clostridiales bacterium]